jgi:OOP family OmpA-OmpF porin
MNKFVITLFASSAIALSSGCATKGYVRKEMNPTVAKVNELDELTAQNTNSIRDVDQRAQSGITGVNAKAQEVDQKAQAAGQRASEAQNLASNASTRADKLGNVVANLDSYKPVAEASVHFGFDQDVLSRKAKEALDQLAAEIPNTKGYIVELVGGADSTGDKDYNYDLSERRVAAVKQYLAAEHNIPAHKIYVIGIGEDKAVSSNSTRQGRAENRRVDVRLMSNTSPSSEGSTASSTPPGN